jgi:hypothetical protein
VGPATTACGSKANGAAGIVVVGRSIGNVIKNSVIGCNVIGVLLQSVITDSQTTTVGPGNYIGVDAAQHALGNGYGAGVDVQEIGSTIISNTIAENTPDGVLLEDTFGFVTGNIIAVNGCNGVHIAGGSNNIVGDFVSHKAGNTIEDNFCYGVEVSGGGSYSNTISDNLVGDDGHANMAGGVHLTANSHGNTVSHYFSGANDINHNAGPGILIDGGAHDNFIGDNSILSNAGNGIQLSGANTTGNVISQTVVAANGLDGINERNNASGNRWSQVSIFLNGGLGIDRLGGNDANNNPDQPLPVIDAAVVSGPNVVVHGHVPPPPLLTNNTVELYAVNVDPSGYGEGQHYLGSGAVDGTGRWTVSYAGLAVGCYTGFETISSLLSGNPPYSGEFGPNSCRVMLPVIRR